MIFVDTSFWIALRLHRDRNHTTASELMATYGTAALVTSAHVVGETWTFLNRKVGRHAALDFLNRTESAAHVDIVSVTPDQEREAFAFLRLRDEREYSFVDATSFVVMRSERITRALAFDGDFSAAGFDELRP